MYKTVFVGGTFDGLHKGHEAVLSRAFGEGEHVVIGITSDEYVKKVKSQKAKVKNTDQKLKIRLYYERKRTLEVWLKDNHFLERATIQPIDDAYEPAASAPYDALVVTPQNKKVGDEINARRLSRGIAPVTLLEVSLITAPDGTPISSTRMRQGEIDREGNLTMPENLRGTLQQPLGTVLVGDRIVKSLTNHSDAIIICVGDVTTKTILDAGITPALAIIDFQVNRKPFDHRASHHDALILHSIKVKSGPGYIAKEAISSIQTWATSLSFLRKRESILNQVEDDKKKETSLSKSFTLIVDGEEDLLALPAVAFAPFGSVVYYGQPASLAWGCGPVQEGLVEVEINTIVQKKALKLLDQFIVQ